VEISSDAVRASQLHLENVTLKRKAGASSDFDVLRAEVELSNFNAQLIQNKNAVNVAKANLLRVMGVSQESDITIAEELTYNPESTTIDEAVGAAFHNRPDLMGHEFDTRLQKELLRIAKSQYWPTVNGFFQNGWMKPDPHDPTILNWGQEWNAGIAAMLPLFSGFSREGQVVEQKARLKQSQINLVDTEERALFEVTKSMASVANAAEFVDSQKLNLTRAKESLRLSEVGYKEGTQIQVEVIDAEAALTQARVFYYQAIYSHIIAKLDLQKAMGTLTGGQMKN
jgi:outer membrane protein TolC